MDTGLMHSWAGPVDTLVGIVFSLPGCSPAGCAGGRQGQPCSGKHQAWVLQPRDQPGFIRHFLGEGLSSAPELKGQLLCGSQSWGSCSITHSLAPGCGTPVSHPRECLLCPVCAVSPPSLAVVGSCPLSLPPVRGGSRAGLGGHIQPLLGTAQSQKHRMEKHPVAPPSVPGPGLAALYSCNPCVIPDLRPWPVPITGFFLCALLL